MSSEASPSGWGVGPALASSVPRPSPALSSTIPSPVPKPSTVLLGPSTSPSPTPTDFTVVLPFPPPSSTTITSVITLQPTNITTIITTTIPTNVVSTVTETSTTLQLSITPLANPAATSAIAGQSSILRSNASLSKTNLTVSVILGSLSLSMVVALLVIFLLYVRKRRKNERPKEDDESPPFTSLAPRPAMDFGEGRFMSSSSLDATSALPVGVVRSGNRDRERKRSVSRVGETGPRGGMVEGDSRAVEAGAGFRVSTPRREFYRSSSAPVEAPTPPPRILPFKGLNLSNMSIFGRSPRGTPSPGKGKGKDLVFGSPGTPTTPGSRSNLRGGLRSAGLEPRPSIDLMKLVRQSSMPLYHESLRDQAEMEREAIRRLQAEDLGWPVIAVQRTSPNEEGAGRGNEKILVSELFELDLAKGGIMRADLDEEEGSDSDDEMERERERKAGLSLRVGMGGSEGESARAGFPHSTRASSGVFPEDDREIEKDEVQKNENNVYS